MKFENFVIKSIGSAIVKVSKICLICVFKNCSSTAQNQNVTKSKSKVILIFESDDEPIDP